MRKDWEFYELEELYYLPLLQLIMRANEVYHQYHVPYEVQICSLISVKTGGCPEDCKYCSQSSHYQTSVSAQPLMKYDEVLSLAKRAISRGATRICLGAAWREVRNSLQFEEVLQIVKDVTALGVQVCCTLGMLNDEQAKRLKEAGLYAYNHNLDTSENYYNTIITTRTYQDRLQTLDTVAKNGLSICCGGIIGMGESIEDRLQLLLTLSRRNPQPDSVPINRLSPIQGTPLEKRPQTTIWEMVRMVAVARIIMPKAMVRLSAGRLEMTYEQQALCFLAGANSIHAGEKLLTVENPSFDRDHEMFNILGLKIKHNA